jgi:long-subunit fatty acid transport protein
MYDNVNDVSLVLPSGSTWRFGTGMQRQLNERSSLGASFEYLMVEDLKVASPNVLAGSYDNMGMYFFCLNYSYRF